MSIDNLKTNNLSLKDMDKIKGGITPLAISLIAAGIGAAGSVAKGVSASKVGSANRKFLSGAIRDSASLGQGGLSAINSVPGVGFQTVDFREVDPLDFIESGFALTEDGFNFQSELGQRNRTTVLGEENTQGFDAFKRESLEQARFDFTSIPQNILDTLDKSALARSISGPAGQAENLSVQNKIALANRGQNSLFQSLAFDNQFVIDPPNPLNTVFDLADFDFRNSQSQLSADQFNSSGLLQADMFNSNLELTKAQSLLDTEFKRFGITTGLQGQFAANDAGAIRAGNVGNFLDTIARGGTAIGGQAVLGQRTKAEDASRRFNNNLLFEIENRVRRHAGLSPLNKEQLGT